MPTRGYKMDEREGESAMAREIRATLVKDLAARWNAIHRELDRAFLLRDADADAEREAEEDEDAYDAAVDAAVKARTEARRAFLRDNPSATVAEVQAEGERAYADALDEARESHASRYDQHMSKLDEKLAAIEEVLAGLGARMMRPYEHHGEMESYYEYAERDRDDDRDW